MLTSIVIATYNKLDYTKQCIESIRNYTEPGSYEIIVVDNNSTDETVKWLEQQRDLQVIYNELNNGFPRACNQGIEVAQGDILLLNNDTVVTRGWLSQLQDCLYSQDEIGAVGSVTNSCSYAQTVPVTYESMVEMQAFADEFNQQDPSKWEERLKLIGYCMLIKRAVVNEIGLLDEQFSPGNYEDDDYSLRIRLAGYKLLLCKDTFIHHYGSVSFREAPPEYHKLMQGNRQKFANKWGIDPDIGFVFRTELPLLLMRSLQDQQSLQVLEIGCRCGGNLLQIYSANSNVELYGYERDPNMAQVAGRVTERVSQADFMDENNEWKMGTFDYILISESISLWSDPAARLNKLKGLLKETGVLYAYVPNLSYYSRIDALLRGGNSGFTHNSGLTFYEATRLFEETGLTQVSVTGITYPESARGRAYIEALSNLSDSADGHLLEIQEFLFQASNLLEIQKNINPATSFKDIVNGVLTDREDQEKVEALIKCDPDEVIAVVEESAGEQRVTILNYLAVLLLEHQQPKLAQSYLQQALEWNSEENHTIFNLGLVAYQLNQLSIALEWFGLLPNPNSQIQAWVERIQAELRQEGNAPKRIAFALRRIEHHIHAEASLDEITGDLRSGACSLAELEREAAVCLIDKAYVMTRIGMACFNEGNYDDAIALLQIAIEYDPNHTYALEKLNEMAQLIG